MANLVPKDVNNLKKRVSKNELLVSIERTHIFFWLSFDKLEKVLEGTRLKFHVEHRRVLMITEMAFKLSINRTLELFVSF